MSQPQTNDSGTIQVRRFTGETESTEFHTAALIIAAGALVFSLALAQLELYTFYKYVLMFHTG